MNLLMTAAKKMVTQNIKNELSSEVIDLLSLCTLAVTLRNPIESFAKLPELFQNLTVLAEDKNISQISQKYRNVSIDYTSEEELMPTLLLHDLIIHTDYKQVEKKEILLISTQKSISSMKSVYVTIGELFRLLRSQEIENLETVAKIRNGLKIEIYNFNNQTLEIRHHHIENGMIDRCCQEAIEALLSYIDENEIEESPLLKRMEEDDTKYNDIYNPIEIELMDTLCTDSMFESLLEKTFYEEALPQVVKYYNQVMNRNSAFSSMSNLLNYCCHYYENDDEINYSKYQNLLHNVEDNFLTLCKRKK